MTRMDFETLAAVIQQEPDPGFRRRAAVLVSVACGLTNANFNTAKFLGACGVEPSQVEWSGKPDPSDPDNFWIDDDTGERVDARTGERSRS